MSRSAMAMPTNGWTASMSGRGREGSYDGDDGRSLGEPFVEDFELIFGRIDEKDAHAAAFDEIDDLAGRHKGVLAAGNAHVELGAHGKDVHGVHVAAFAADLLDASGDFSGGGEILKFGDGDKVVAGYHPPLNTAPRRLV